MRLFTLTLIALFCLASLALAGPTEDARVALCLASNWKPTPAPIPAPKPASRVCSDACTCGCVEGLQCRCNDEASSQSGRVTVKGYSQDRCAGGTCAAPMTYAPPMTYTPPPEAIPQTYQGPQWVPQYAPAPQPMTYYQPAMNYAPPPSFRGMTMRGGNCGPRG